MAGKANSPFRKRSTATSLAAFKTAPAVPPSSRARRARRRAGNRSWSGSRNVSRAKSLTSKRENAWAQRLGQVSAYWIGSRMSGRLACATTEPSTNSTMECTTDCGCTTTSICSGRRSKSQRASITSSALFIRVAESIVILGPMDQVGWRSASVGVARAMRFSLQVQNGPPEAVRITRDSSSRRPAESAWKIAECSLSTGRIRPPHDPAMSISSGPAATSDSLFASARVLPRRSASTETGRPAAPDAALSTTSASSRARGRSLDPARPR